MSIIEIIFKNNNMETLEWKNTLNEVKYLLEGISSLFKLAEERIIELEINQ